MIEKAKKLVEELLKNENSGHGMEHINRVLDLAMKFADKEDCNKNLVTLGVLLHDVDDYKIWGAKNQEELTNTNKILDEIGVSQEIKEAVIQIVSKIGYSKRLKGIFSSTIEGQIVSDADMCDAMGANGIIRVHKYCLKHGTEFFNKDLWPIENMEAGKYTEKCADSAVCHIFEKILRLKNLMMTDAGKQEAIERHNFVVSFLRQLFKEENAYDWEQYLDNYLSNLD